MNPHEQKRFEGVQPELLRNAMEREWKQVITKYKEDTTAHGAKINMSGDTALHLAISDENQPVVEELVRIIDEAKTLDALKIKNVLGNTPLHLAAYMGNASMCYCIASRTSELLGIRNAADETPLFIAVGHGRKEAFLRMHYLCEDVDKAYSYCGRQDGRTILHTAISGEHFDLALQIIHLYPKFQNRVDERGFTPLHLLASKPSAFRSGRHMGLLRKLVYDSIYVDKLKYPEDPRTPLRPTDRLRNITLAQKGHTVQKIDAENPNIQPPVHEKATVPENHSTCFFGLNLILKAMGVIVGFDSIRKGKIREEKKKHTWSVQIMEKLIEYEHQFGSSYPWSSKKRGESRREKSMVHDDHSPQLAPNDGTLGNGKKDGEPFRITEGIMEMKKIMDMEGKTDESSEVAVKDDEKKKSKALTESEMKESPLLRAAKHGIIEMVKKILETFPMAIHDHNSDGKNIVLLAVENRQPHVYQFLLDTKIMKETLFYKRDNNGNSALHIAAKLVDKRSWLIPGPALQMQWEIKWYQFVRKSMPPKFFAPYNKDGHTAWEIFTETHKELVKEAGKWLYKTSESCSVVAILIATVAFTASAAIPGGLNSESGTPLLAKQLVFNVFAIASLIALCFSIASVMMFMVFFTSRYREKDFGTNLPTKLLVELTSLIISIAAVLISFCAAHFYVIKDSFKYTAFSLYAATLLPVALYAFGQIPVYAWFAVATFKKDPQRIYDHD